MEPLSHMWSGINLHHCYAAYDYVKIYCNRSYVNVVSLKISCTVLTLSLKGSTLQLLFGYLNCQHHYSCTLGPLLSKIRVTGTLRLWYHYGRADNRDGYYRTSRGACLQRADAGQRDESRLGSGQGQPAWDAIVPLRMSHNLKVMNCLFLEFLIKCFGALLSMANKLYKEKQ